MSAPITILGRLGQDPELRFTPSGVAVVKLSVVTDRRTKQGDEWVSVDTTWWNVTAFKQLAENAADSLAKGDAVIIVGRVKSHSWEDAKTGEKRTAMDVTADSLGPDLARVRKTEARHVAPIAEDDPWATPAATTEPPF